jgi:putative peptide zinc metalloprotease protein
MNTRLLPRLREDAIVRRFDERGRQARYVIAIDGHHFVVTPTVAAVLDETRQLRPGECDIGTLCARVAVRLGHEVAPQQIETLLVHRSPRRFFEADAAEPSDESPVKCRRLLIGGQRLTPLLAALGRLFAWRIAIGVCLLIAAVDIAVAEHFFRAGTALPAARDHLLAFALTLLGILCHELGHLAACHRFGGRHGGIGVGVYWCLPAFYAEVHGAWLLPRLQRAAVDVGGIYLQATFVMLLGCVYLIEPSPACISAIVVSHFLMLHTLNPVLKFDGYWLLCDLAGIHNLHESLRRTSLHLISRLRPIVSGRQAIGPARPLPNRAELALLGAFLLLAAAYFAYLLGILGAALGSTAAALRFAWLAADGSFSSSAGIFARSILLILILATAMGSAALIGRAACSINPNRSLP